MNDRVERKQKASPRFIPCAVLLIAMLGVSRSPASEKAEQADDDSNAHVVPVDLSHFTPEALVGEIGQEERPLADGTRALSYVSRT